MPRYFFNVRDGKDVVDQDGTELTGLDEARRQAIITAGAMLAEHGNSFWTGDTWQMSVLDEDGSTVLRLDFSAVSLV